VQDEGVKESQRRLQAVNVLRTVLRKADRVCTPVLYQLAGFIEVAAIDAFAIDGDGMTSELDQGDIDRVREYLTENGKNQKVTTIRKALRMRSQTVSNILKYLKTLGEFRPD